MRVLPFLFFLATSATAQTVITLDGNSPGKTFDGLGAVSAGASSRLLVDYPEPQRSQILDYLFKPNYGASLQRLKIEIGADVNSTDGSEPSHMRTSADHDYTRGYEWWLMMEARKRNPKIVLEALPWGAPGWVSSNPATLYTPSMAEYTVDFLLGSKRVHHLDIQYVGIWNEKWYNADYVKILHDKIQKNNLSTKIVCCDYFDDTKRNQWGIADAMKDDPILNRDIAALGAHYPRNRAGKTTVTEVAKIMKQPIWSSEDQPNPGGGPFLQREWNAGGRVLAHYYNDNYIQGRLTATEIWSPVTSYYDNLAAPHSGLMYANTPWSGNYNVQSTIWVTAHTTQFAHPGWRYLDKSVGYLPGNGSYVTLKSPTDRNWSVVLETVGATTPRTVSFRLQGGLSETPVHVWLTDNAHTFEHVGDVRPTHGEFQFTFAPDALYTLTTTTGQGRGSVMPPPAKPFPAIYRDNFEQTPINRTPKYLADQDGAFEVHPCAERSGRCLEQVITDKPVSWLVLPDPFTLTGDSNATDYDIALDYRLENAGSVRFMTRIDSADVFSDRKALLPSAYVFTVNADGAWSLVSSEFKKPTVVLVKGAISSQGHSWHHVILSAKADRIDIKLDGVSLASVHDSKHTHGMFGFGTDWNRAQFDNLSVMPNE